MPYRLLPAAFAGQVFNSLSEAMAYADRLHGEYIIIEDRPVARSKVKKVWVQEEEGDKS